MSFAINIMVASDQNVDVLGFRMFDKRYGVSCLRMCDGCDGVLGFGMLSMAMMEPDG